MNLLGQFPSVDGGNDSAVDQIEDLLMKKIFYERRRLPFSGESRYLPPLIVFWTEEQRSDSTRSTITRTSSSVCSEVIAEKMVCDPQYIKDKIRAALKLLSVRDQHVLIQFWTPRAVGWHHLLTTVDQPFGLGVADEGLCLYRRESENNLIFVDKDHEEDDASPPARVFRRGLPEWTSDVSNYLSKDFPLQECAIKCNLNGYLALPVFDSPTRSCVGVLELLMSSKDLGYAYEVQQVHKALKAENLTSPQALDCSASNVPNELDEILNIMKVVCDVHNLPLAQTWAVSPFSSYVAHEKTLEKSCNSFNIRCIGKVCMSTAALPFYVRDLSMWGFRKACREQHLEKSRGLVGRALLSRGCCFCGDVTKLSEQEYPLVHNARMSHLTSCLAIFLHHVKGNDEDYVLEFFLPSEAKDSRQHVVLNLMQTLKQNMESVSGFELGDLSSSIQDVGPYSEVGHPSLDIEPHNIDISSTTTANALTSAMDLEPNVATTNPAYPSTSKQKTHDRVTNVGEKSNPSKQGIKRKIDSLRLEQVQQQFGTSIDEAAKSLGVSRSTLKRFCREHDISRWPRQKHNKINALSVDESLEQSGANATYIKMGTFKDHLGPVDIASEFNSLLPSPNFRDEESSQPVPKCSGNPVMCVSTGKSKDATDVHVVIPSLDSDWNFSEFFDRMPSPKSTLCDIYSMQDICDLAIRN